MNDPNRLVFQAIQNSSGISTTDLLSTIENGTAFSGGIATPEKCLINRPTLNKSLRQLQAQGLIAHKPSPYKGKKYLWVATSGLCQHPSSIIGLDGAYCPDCKQEFSDWSPEYKRLTSS